jgi:RNA-binding motif protein, X-linked 2
MNQMKHVQKLSEMELRNATDLNSSWHKDYLDSAYIYVGSLSFDLTEGDILTIFSQYGEIEDINLVRDRKTGKSKGFCFLKYEDALSAVLAVDNFNGISVAGRSIRVDHSRDYRQPEAKEGDEEAELRLRREQEEKRRAFLEMEQKALQSPSDDGIDDADVFLQAKKDKEERKLQKKAKRESIAKELGLEEDDPMRDFLVEEELRKRKKQRK